MAKTVTPTFTCPICGGKTLKQWSFWRDAWNRASNDDFNVTKKAFWHAALLPVAIPIDALRKIGILVAKQPAFFGEKKPILSRQFQCEACHVMAMVCPLCLHVWKLDASLRSGTDIKCPKCLTDFIFL
jgi:predicted RNA-binding Zn-ribbon protein involved in translation (DUF1610 family)